MVYFILINSRSTAVLVDNASAFCLFSCQSEVLANPQFSSLSRSPRPEPKETYHQPWSHLRKRFIHYRFEGYKFNKLN